MDAIFFSSYHVFNVLIRFLFSFSFSFFGLRIGTACFSINYDKIDFNDFMNVKT